MNKDKKNEQDLGFEQESELQKEKEEKENKDNELEYDDLEIEYEDETSLKDKIKKLRDKLKKCEKEKRDYLEGWQRMKADALNEKRRLQDAIAKARQEGKTEAVRIILPVIDSFDMAFRGDSWDKLDEIWKQGIEYIHKQFEDALQQLGVESYAKEGDKFNVNLHEAIKEKETNEKEKDGQIFMVLRKGYKMGDNVLRPAQVEVFVYKKENKEEMGG